MTIFLEIAQHFLQQQARTIVKASEEADRSMTNTVAGFFSMGRDLDLSAEKRALMDGVLRGIATQTDGETDAATLANFCQSLATTREAISKKSRERGYPEGHVEAGLFSMERLLHTIYAKLMSLGLHDKPHDTNPLNIFRYFAALYCSQKIVDDLNADIWSRFKAHPNISSLRLIADQKEVLLTECLQSCTKELEAFDAEHESYGLAAEAHVLGSIAQLQRDNTALCEAGALKVSPLAFVDIELKAFQPREGFLKECLQNAVDGIMENSTSRPRKLSK